MDLEVKPEYYEPCTNTDIVRRVLMNLFNSYAHMNMKESKLIDKVLAAYNADGL